MQCEMYEHQILPWTVAFWAPAAYTDSAFHLLSDTKYGCKFFAAKNR